MKILYHHRTASRDGQAVHIDEMIHALREAGHEVHVVAPAAPPPGKDMGGQVWWVRLLRTLVRSKAAYEVLELAYSLVAYRRLMAAARSFKPDVLYERYNLYMLGGLMAKRRLGLPMLLEINAPLADERQRYGGLGLPRMAAWAEGKVWRGADVVLPVTQVLAQKYVMGRGVPAERIVVVHNGINEAHFGAAPSPQQAKKQLGLDGALVLGFTGFVRDWHGVDRVLRWMAGPSAPANARLLVVGDGPARSDLEQLAAQLNLGERVRFTGLIGRELVPAHVAAFDIALQPAVVEYASPLKMFEYLALGKAIVAPRVPNIQELLVDGENALLFDDKAQGALEQALTRLCAEPALRERVAAGAAATVPRMGLTWRGNAQRAVDLARQLLSRSRPSSGVAHGSAGAGK